MYYVIFLKKLKLTCFWHEAHFDLVHCFVSIFIFSYRFSVGCPLWNDAPLYFCFMTLANQITSVRTGSALIYLFPDRLNKLFRGLPEERVAVSFSPNMLCPALSTDVWTPFKERIKRVALCTGQRVCEITKIGKLCVCWGSGSAVALAAEPGGVTWPPQTQGPVHSWLGG